VPADRRAGRVYGQKRVRQIVWSKTRKSGRAGADRKQKFRHRLGLFKSGALEIVAPVEGENTALGDEALKQKFGQRQRANPRDELALLVG
jgi:hypothetical protein